MYQKFSSTEELIRSVRPYLDWLLNWSNNLEETTLASEIRALGGQTNRLAIIIQDMVLAFCCEGTLASERVKAIIDPIVDLLKTADALGVEHFLLSEDRHKPDALEFRQFGWHAAEGSIESQTVPEIANLPFADKYLVFPKNTLHPALGTGFERWLDQHPEVTTFIEVGNCTDLCVYQTVMYLKLRGNLLGRDYNIIVPENCVDTYNASVEVAAPKGIMPHDANLLHLVFLSHMALNGARVVKRIT